MTYWKNLFQACLTAAVLFSPLTLFAFANHGRLGPTGLTGHTDYGRKTIKVTAVAKGSPADGKIKPNDVIIGVNGSKFTGDPRRAMAAAIDESETRKAGGKMTLILSDKRTVVIKLRVLGTYSATAPYKCKKTNKIISEMAESLLTSKHSGGGCTKSGILGLMATGEKKYMAAVKKMVRADTWVKKGDGKPMKGGIYSVWGWGYATIAFSEYYLLTKDRSVLPAIRSLALTLALSQDGGGMYGHTPVKPNGRLHGYAQMNQPTLSAFMGMLLARECGIKDPRLDKAIAKTNTYVTNHIGKGAFGYGVGSGWTRGFNNNGTSGSAALCMAFNRNSKGAKFFSQMASTAFDGLEHGHACTFFNPLWTPLGANVSGPYVTQQFFRRSLWLHNLRRRWDGGYGSDTDTVGPWAGVALLTYCLPRKALLITGRNADKSNWLKRDAATKVVIMSQWNANAASNKELVDRYLSTHIPQIKRRASWALLKHRTPKQREELKALWASYLKSGTDKQKTLALDQHGMHTPLAEKQHLLKDIGGILRDKQAPVRLRITAAYCLGNHFGRLAHPYYMDIVKLLAKDRPDDPFGDLDRSLGGALNGISRTPFGERLVTDKDLFYKAANKLMSYKREAVIEVGVRMLSDMPLKDFHYVGDNILHIAKNDDPTMHRYHGLQAYQTSIELLIRFRIKEGLDCLENGFKGQRFNNEIKAISRLLPMYGAHAKSAVDALEKKHPKMIKSKFGRHWVNAAKAIRASNDRKKLVSFKEAMQTSR